MAENFPRYRDFRPTYYRGSIEPCAENRWIKRNESSCDRKSTLGGRRTESLTALRMIENYRGQHVAPI